jgi:hypothetical protein
VLSFSEISVLPSNRLFWWNSSPKRGNCTSEHLSFFRAHAHLDAHAHFDAKTNHVHTFEGVVWWVWISGSGRWSHVFPEVCSTSWILQRRLSWQFDLQGRDVEKRLEMSTRAKMVLFFLKQVLRTSLSHSSRFRALCAMWCEKHLGFSLFGWFQVRLHC